MPLDNPPPVPDGWKFVSHLTLVTKQFILQSASVKIEDTIPVEGGEMVIYTAKGNLKRAILTLGEMYCMLCPAE